MQHPKRTSTLGLIGLYRCGNIGDEAIWRAFVQALRPLLPASWEVRLITFGPGGFETGCVPPDNEQTDEFLHQMVLDDPKARKIGLRFWLGGGLFRFLKTLLDLDAVWYAGGHWLHDLSASTLAGVMLPLLWARMRGANAGFVNVGAGPLTSRFGKRLAAAGLGARGPLVVRDEHSRKVLRAARIRKDPRLGADTAFLLKPASEARVDQAWQQAALPADQPVVGIVPCAWFAMAHLYRRRSDLEGVMIDALADRMRHLAERGMAVALVPTMLPEDERVAERIGRLAGEGPFSIVPTRQIPARVLMGMIAKMRALISFRMHPLLFAIASGTPFVALNYAPKVDSLVRDVGLERWLVDLNDGWPDELARRLDALFESPDPFEGMAPLEPMRQRAQNGLAQAIETLKI